MEKLKILIADDSAVYRKVMTEAVEKTRLAYVVKVAVNGAEALDYMAQEPEIDVVLLDIFMPVLDGLQTLKVIKSRYPNVEVLMISTGGTNSALTTLEALNNGALDFLLKPSETNLEKSIQLIKNYLQTVFNQINLKKISRFTKEILSKNSRSSTTAIKPHIDHHHKNTEKGKWTGADLVLIASSTGGPTALEKESLILDLK